MPDDTTDSQVRIAELERRIEVEEALERVRARTMAMHRSEELLEVARITHEQLRALGVGSDMDSFSFVIMNEEAGAMTCWSTMLSGIPITHSYTIVLAEFPPMLPIYDAWRSVEPERRKDEVLVKQYTSEEFLSMLIFLTEVNKLEGHEIVKDFQEKPETLPPQWVVHDAFFEHGILTIQCPEAFDTSAISILKRFSRVFEQAYTRFLDLKQAEEQAREAQIEAGLERVRAQSMAMHRSDELAKAAELLYQESRTLGITPWSCGYVFLDEQTGQSSVWNTEPDGTLFMGMWTIPSTEHPVLRDRYESWKQREPLHRVVLEGDVLTELNRYIARYSPLTEEELALVPERLAVYTANFSHGYLIVASRELMTVEEEQTLVRFAKVFEMTYTRFLDLQQAEAHAREAQIEAAIERVRARTMAMHKSEELAETAQLMFQQVV